MQYIQYPTNYILLQNTFIHFDHYTKLDWMLLQITLYIDRGKSLCAKNHIVCCLQGWFCLRDLLIVVSTSAFFYLQAAT